MTMAVKILLQVTFRYLSSRASLSVIQKEILQFALLVELRQGVSAKVSLWQGKGRI